MGKRSGVVIVGAGVAAAEAATALRRHGFADRIVVIGEEKHSPYQRPPLSKAYLSGNVAAQSLHAKQHDAYDKANVELELGTRVEQIDRGSKHIVLSDKRHVSYSNLILAVGGYARKLSTLLREAADHLTNLHTIRTIDDVDRLKDQFVPGKRAVIIGGGYIGLEVAAAAVKCGLKVCVIERLPRVLARVTAPEVSSFYEHVHREAGVNIRTDVEISGLELSNNGAGITAVQCANGDAVAADVVIVGIGMIPNTELARAAGLDVGNGIIVDESARTTDPHIFAIGDCSNRPCPPDGQRVRLESLPNALEQARAAAASICSKPPAKATVPWFWSDQYDLKLQIAGISTGYDRVVVRGATKNRRFSVLYLKLEKIIAADAVNCPEDFNAARNIISQQADVDLARMSDMSLPLATLS